MGKDRAVTRRRVTAVTEQKIDHRRTSVIITTRRRPPLTYVTSIQSVNSVFRGLKSNLRHRFRETTNLAVAEKLPDTFSHLKMFSCVPESPALATILLLICTVLLFIDILLWYWTCVCFIVLLLNDPNSYLRLQQLSANLVDSSTNMVWIWTWINKRPV